MATEGERPLRAPVPLRFERPDIVLQAAGNLTTEGRVEEAGALVGRVLDADPEHPGALALSGSIRERCGEWEAALDCYERALALDPENAVRLSNYIFALDRAPSTTLEKAYAVRRRYNDLVKADPKPFALDRTPGRRLRVGYVSSDFRQHSAVYSFGPVLLKHDRTQFETYAYSCSPEGDWITSVFEEGMDHFRRAGFWGHDRLEAQIREDRIDVLVDLSGHSAGNRLPVFARKPAPVQVTAWGYITGTGLDAMDAMFADPDTVPPAEDGYYAEEVIRLPRILSYWVPDPEHVGEVTPAPVLRNGYVTFGVFQRLGKLKPEAVALWARVLAAVPDARLVVKSPGLEHEHNRRRVLRRFEAAGIDPARLEFRGRSGHYPHLREHADVDLMLDPWPDGGGVSTMEAAWMGVPTLSLPHHLVPSRVSASVMREVGLPMLAVGSADEYVERAADVAAQPTALAEVRAALRELLRVSAFCDHERAVRSVENTYRALWDRWCAGRTDPLKPALRLVG